MELRSKLNVTSSWKESTNLQHVLYISNSIGSVLDYPHNRDVEAITLSQPASSGEELTACYLHIQSMRTLLGYFTTGVEVQSGSRNVEVYVEDDYVCTCRGSLVKDSDCLQENLFEWRLDLPSEYHGCNSMTLKLLSLKGRLTVDVKKLTVYLSEDHGGKEALLETTKSQSVAPGTRDLQELFNSLPNLTANAPPFLGSLISTLKSCQASQRGGGEGKGAAAPSDSLSSQSSVPPKVAYMISAFHGMHPTESTATPTPAAAERSASKDGGADTEVREVQENTSTSEVLTLAHVEALMDEKMKELESRLIKYIDTRLTEMMNTFRSGSEIDLKTKKETDSDILTMHRDKESEHNQYSVCEDT